MSLFNLKNKSILITGSSRGIGKSIAYQCAAHGANVIISSRKEEMCIETAKEINNKFGSDTALSIPANISDASQLEHLVSQTRKYLEKLLVLDQFFYPLFAPQKIVYTPYIRDKLIQEF